MRRIAALAWLNLQQLLHDRSQLSSIIGLPLILTLFFGMMLGGGERRIAVAVADADRTEYSRDLLSSLGGTGYDVRRVSEADARQAVFEGSVAAAVFVPKDFGDDVLLNRPVEVVVEKDPRNMSSLAVVETMRGAAQRMAADAVAVQNVAEMYGAADPRATVPPGAPSRYDVYLYAQRLWQPNPPVSINNIDVQQSAVRSNAEIPAGFSQYSLGFTVTFMVFMAMAGAGGFLEEREIGTLRRLLTTPTNKATLVGGKLAGIFATTIFQAAVMITLGATLFRVPWGQDPLGVATVIVAFGLAATGLGVLISTIVRTRGQMSAITAVLAISIAMLGGCYWPIDIVSPAMRAIGMLTPNYWAMQGLVSVVVRNQGLGAAIGPAVVLLGFAAVFFTVGLKSLKFE